MKRFLRRLLWGLLLAVVVYGTFVILTGYQKLESSLSEFEWSAFALALGLATFNYVLRFLKWEYYLGKLGIRHVPKVDSFLVFLSGFVLTVTPGKVGEVFKSAVLNDTHGVPVSRTAPVVVAERLTDVIGVIVLIVSGSIGFSNGLRWAVLGSALVGIGLTFILWPKPALAFIGWASRGPKPFRRLAPKLEEAFAALRLIASPSALLWPTVLSVVGWGCEGFALYLLLQGFGVEGPIALAIFFYATATLAGAIIPVPGGLGVAETMIQEQLVRLGGVPGGAATASMLLIRFATLWWAVVVGFIALFLLKRRFPELLQDEAEAIEKPTESHAMR